MESIYVSSGKPLLRAIARLVTMTLIGVAVLAIAGLATVIVTYRGADHETGALVATSFASHERALELAVAEKDMEADITAIQEQAEDAGDVGNAPEFAADVKEDYEGVRKAAADFAADAAKARAIAAQFNDTAALKAIDSITDAVPDLREAALKMAIAYVNEGRAAGNIKMKPFDEEVERLKGLTAPLRKSVTSIVARARGEMDIANAARTHAEWIALAIGGLVGLLLAAASAAVVVMFQRKLLTPIRRMTDVMAQLARHDLACIVEGTDRKDEIGEMASAVQVFKDNMIEGNRLKEEQEEARRSAAVRTAKMDALARDFESNVGGVVEAATRKQPN